MIRHSISSPYAHATCGHAEHISLPICLPALNRPPLSLGSHRHGVVYVYHHLAGKKTKYTPDAISERAGTRCASARLVSAQRCLFRRIWVCRLGCACVCVFVSEFAQTHTHIRITRTRTNCALQGRTDQQQSQPQLYLEHSCLRARAIRRMPSVCVFSVCFGYNNDSDLAISANNNPCLAATLCADVC